MKEVKLSDEFEKLIKTFDQNRQFFSNDWKTVDEINLERKEFVSKFPIESILDLILDQYVIGKKDLVTGETNRTTFCYLLEHSLGGFGGIGASTAQKFGIFRRKGKDEYYFNEQDFVSVDDAFSELKNELLIILEIGKNFQENGNVLELSQIIDEGHFQIQRHVISKILAVYYPDVFLCISSNFAINEILDYFKIPRKDIDNAFQIKKNEIFHIKNKHPIMKNWNSPDYSHFILKSIVKSAKKKIKSHNIIIKNDSSSPTCAETNSCLSENKIFIDSDDTVTWKNDDSTHHTITSGTPDDGPDKVFDSELLAPNDVFSFQFKNNGTYNYFDLVHPWIRGEIVVGKEIITEEIKDSPLKLPNKEKLQKGVENITKDLLIDPKVIEEIVINLASGRHILLAGPIGTGKTQLALRIPKIFWSDDYGYFPDLHTATADWSTNDVIGGIMPKMKGDTPTYKIQLGCVSQTVRSNWDKENPSKRILPTHENETYKGTWLVIDEFNRADIDKAMGQLFTALETRELKVPTSKIEDFFDQLTIPKDYRIIGTLNTADKHYLFKLSDALKRRFAYIEVPPPTPEQKEQEIFFALKNALKDFENEDIESIIVLDEDNRQVDESSSNKELVNAINNAYDVLAVIRGVKPLGTAILKSIYQTLVIGAKITEDSERSLDSSINVNLIPQLENLQTSTLESIMEFLFGEPIEFFKKKSESEIFSEKYANDFRAFLKYIGANKMGKRVDAFKKNTIDEPAWNSIKNSFEESKLKIKLPMFEQSLRELIDTSSMI